MVQDSLHSKSKIKGRQRERYRRRAKRRERGGEGGRGALLGMDGGEHEDENHDVQRLGWQHWAGCNIRCERMASPWSVLLVVLADQKQKGSIEGTRKISMADAAKSQA